MIRTRFAAALRFSGASRLQGHPRRRRFRRPRQKSTDHQPDIIFVDIMMPLQRRFYPLDQYLAELRKITIVARGPKRLLF